MDPIPVPIDWLAHGMSGLLLAILATLGWYFLKREREHAREREVREGRIKVLEEEKDKLEIDYRGKVLALKDETYEKVERLHALYAQKLEARDDKFVALAERSQLRDAEIRDALKAVWDALRGGGRR